MVRRPRFTCAPERHAFREPDTSCAGRELVAGLPCSPEGCHRKALLLAEIVLHGWDVLGLVNLGQAVQPGDQPGASLCKCRGRFGCSGKAPTGDEVISGAT